VKEKKRERYIIKGSKICLVKMVRMSQLSAAPPPTGANRYRFFKRVKVRL
jgi:hypothetical protein